MVMPKAIASISYMQFDKFGKFRYALWFASIVRGRSSGYIFDSKEKLPQGKRNPRALGGYDSQVLRVHMS
jgi:hypothetical protein